MEWGSLADWTAASAALFAVVFAAMAARDSRALARREAERDRRRDQDADREQAGLVTSWVAVRIGLDGKVASSGVVIQNASTAPVFDLCVRSNDKDGTPRAPLSLSMRPPGDFFAEATDSSYHWTFPDAVSCVPGTLRPVMKKPLWRVDELTFADSASRRWRRDARGVLDLREPVTA